MTRKSDTQRATATEPRIACGRSGVHLENDRRQAETILFVDQNDATRHRLQRAWSCLGLAGEPMVVPNRQQALDVLRDLDRGKAGASVAAVVLDPETTEEETGAFLRKLRKSAAGNTLPLLLWTWDGKTYRALEGRGVRSVVDKPMLLRLIQELDAACRLGALSARSSDATPNGISPQ